MKRNHNKEDTVMGIIAMKFGKQKKFANAILADAISCEIKARENMLAIFANDMSKKSEMDRLRNEIKVLQRRLA